MADVEAWVADGVARRRRAIAELDAAFAERQRGKLASILERNADTEFGRQHRFAALDSYEAFRDAVPVRTAADYGDWWTRTAAGEPGVLCSDPVRAFALSSGTTGAAKLVPVTQALLRGLKRAVGYTAASWIARTGYFGLLRGHALQLSAQTRVRETAAGTPVGYVTGLLSANRTYPFHNLGIPSLEILDLADWTEKFRRIEERYVDFDVRMVFGVPSYVVSFLDGLVEHRGIPDTSPIWPDLRLIVTSGTSIAPYRDRLRRLCPNADFLEMYLATEAPLAFQPDGDSPGLMPMVEDVFFEFVPAAEIGSPSAPRHPLEEVETGRDYAVVVTTPAGLYAYSRGDVVRFVSKSPPRLVVADRIDGALNLATEKLVAAQAEEALRAASVPFVEFLVCPAASATAHEWLVESAAELPPDAAARIDRSLAALNPSYRAVRNGGAVLAPPVLVRVPPGTFARALRHRPGQGKILRVHADRRVRDEVFAAAGLP